MSKFVIAAVAALFASVPAMAITVDGTLDAEYGAPKSSVSYNSAAPTSNFGTPTSENHAAAYDIYLTADQNAVYGYITADRVTGLQFANLYFDLGPVTGNGSELGFEIVNGTAFIPGGAGAADVSSGISFFQTADGLSLEFSIDNSLFTSAIAGLTYGTAIPSLGDDVVLRLSQSFGYSVAGGASYGDDRLGRVTLGGAVPEPATWAMMIGGLALVGASMRRARPRVAFA